MKSVVIEQPGKLLLAERALPQPATDEVRVKVKFASICGSDVHIWHGHNPFARYPRVIGHEFFGVIDAVGQGVDASAAGRARGGRSGGELRPLLSLFGRPAQRLHLAAGDWRPPRRRLQRVCLRGASQKCPSPAGEHSRPTRQPG